MKFEKNKGANNGTFAEPNYGELNYQAKAKKKSLAEEDAEFDENFDGDDDDNLLDKFDDEIEEADFDDLDLDEFDDELNDDDLDVFNDDLDEGIKPRKKSNKKAVDDDEIDDSKFYNDEFKDFDNYTTISDFDDEEDRKSVV